MCYAFGRELEDERRSHGSLDDSSHYQIALESSAAEGEAISGTFVSLKKRASDELQQDQPAKVAKQSKESNTTAVEGEAGPATSASLKRKASDELSRGSAKVAKPSGNEDIGAPACPSTTTSPVGQVDESVDRLKRMLKAVTTENARLKRVNEAIKEDRDEYRQRAVDAETKEEQRQAKLSASKAEERATATAGQRKMENEIGKKYETKYEKLKAAYESKIDKMREDHREAVQNKDNNHKEAMEDLRSRHSKAQKSKDEACQKKNEEMMVKAKKTVGEMKARMDKAEQEQKDLKVKHREEIKRLKPEHSEAIKEKEQALKKVRLEQIKLKADYEKLEKSKDIVVESAGKVSAHNRSLEADIEAKQEAIDKLGDLVKATQAKHDKLETRIIEMKKECEDKMNHEHKKYEQQWANAQEANRDRIQTHRLYFTVQQIADRRGKRIEVLEGELSRLKAANTKIPEGQPKGIGSAIDVNKKSPGEVKQEMMGEDSAMNVKEKSPGGEKRVIVDLADARAVHKTVNDFIAKYKYDAGDEEAKFLGDWSAPESATGGSGV